MASVRPELSLRMRAAHPFSDPTRGVGETRGTVGVGGHGRGYRGIRTVIGN